MTLGAFAAVAVAFACHTHAWVERDGQRSAEGVLDQARDALEHGGAEAVSSLFAVRRATMHGFAVRVTDESNVDVLFISSDDHALHVAEAMKRTGRAPPGEANGDWHIAAARVSRGRSVEVVLLDEASPRVWQRARQVLWLIFGGGLTSAIIGAFVISRRALRPVGDLARATQRIVESGDLTLRVPVRSSADDLEELGHLFNRMLARNEALLRAMKESLDNVAHDLRTPLTRLRAGAEIALRGPPGDDGARDALADVIEETDRVLAMLTTLMDITGAETGSMHLSKTTVELASIVREAVDLYEPVATERGVHVVTRLTSGVLVVVDRGRILQACANLIDNAIKYTPAGGRVEISVTSDSAWATLSIADTGIGIPPEDRPRVWDRLFRGDRSRTERGLGLGLSLVKAVVEAHGGIVRLRSDSPVGSTFEILLRQGGTGAPGSPS